MDAPMEADEAVAADRRSALQWDCETMARVRVGFGVVHSCSRATNYRFRIRRLEVQGHDSWRRYHHVLGAAHAHSRLRHPAGGDLERRAGFLDGEAGGLRF